ncbi:Acyl-CoA N-acyltransferase [Penicillium expansum]|nr:Acyl-CoA N-acyltransferase [Penicillium expansum]
MKIQISPAQFPEDADSIFSLFSGYAASLCIDLTFQSFQEELDSLPGKYAPSQGGSLLIARVGTGIRGYNTNGLVDLISSPQFPSALGCVALRRNSDDWCEMKRLYVLKEARGERLGEKLVEAILTQARDLGYRGMRLDTLPEMRAAQRLYRKYGFVDIEPYYETPIQRTVFMGCEFL